MGPKQSSQRKNQQTSATAIIAHPRFDKVKLLSSKEGQYLQITVPVMSETDVKDWNNSYKKYSAHECLLLPLSEQFKGTQMCGSNGLCNINFDNYPFLLEGQISDRTTSERKHFENAQLWYLSLTILQATNIFHSSDNKVGDIRPVNLFINQHGQAKVATRLSFPQQSTNYEKTVYDKEITYLAPEEIKYEYFGHTQPQVNVQVSEAFSVGLTLLDSALLTKSYDLYNIKNHRFDYQLLQKRISDLFALPFYDQNLKKVIAGLCKINPAERLNCREVFSWLNKYRQRIINIEPFKFEQIPQFLMGLAPQLTTQSILRPVQQSAQPIYFQSQVVAHHPQTVLSSNPLRLINNTPTFQYPVQRVEYKHESVLNNWKLQQQKPSPIVIQRPFERVRQNEVERAAGRGVNVASAPQNKEDLKLTLSKIEEQLQMSRKMFPS